MGESVCFCRPQLARALPDGVTVQGGGSAGPWDLCALSPEGAEQMAERKIRCRTLLVPERAYRNIWQARQVVSYGLSGRNSLTLSSMDGPGVLCVQRALVDCRGRTVEEQELPLPEAWRECEVWEKLLLAGVWLLKGALPESGAE